ncbi:MAG: hypothetical protein RJA98_123 [Pseudomonadota bacterium]|jgi:glucose/arabinose dehydrogenase
MSRHTPAMRPSPAHRTPQQTQQQQQHTPLQAQRRALAALGLSALALAATTSSHASEPLSSLGPNPTLPAPEHRLLPTVNVAVATPWLPGQQPVPAIGLQVTRFAEGLSHPRWLHVLPNGDVLVAESNAPAKKTSGGLMDWIRGLVMKRAGAGVPSADRITLLRDTGGDGVADVRSVFMSGLTSPFGMALVADTLYVANADALVKVPYTRGATQVEAAPDTVLPLPAARNHHWTKNVIASADGHTLYVSVGSNSNVGENGLNEEEGRAAIWAVDRASGQARPYASGLRNPNGMAWASTGKAGDAPVLWTVVNERDELGNDLVPDYLTSVQQDDFFGWPWSYWGTNVDTRVQPPQPDKVARARAPDYALGAHVAALGLARSAGLANWPSAYQSGMFIGEHGSWNREPASGYKVVFVPFANGQPAGLPVDVLTGFRDSEGHALGRPVGVAMDGRGGLLVADDVGNVIWRVTAAGR